MPDHDLNRSLSRILVLALAYLGRSSEADRFGSVRSPATYPAGTLRELRDAGLVHLSGEGGTLYLTEEGVREARGLLKYVQLELARSLGCTLPDVLAADPLLLAEEVAFGAGPLTASELAYALAGVRGAGKGATANLRPTALEVPPASYGRDAENGQALLLKVELPLYQPSRYWSHRSCWRKLLMPAGFTFLDLHIAIQRTLCWRDERPFGFLAHRGRKNLLIGEREVCGDIAIPSTRKRKLEERHASSVRLSEIFSAESSVEYRYGTTGPWGLHVSLAGTAEGLACAGPQLLDGAGDAPPEWVEDIEQFEQFLDELYQDDRQLTSALARAGERGFVPFDHALVRARLMGFEEDRAHWQTRLENAVPLEEPQDIPQDLPL